MEAKKQKPVIFYEDEGGVIVERYAPVERHEGPNVMSNHVANWVNSVDSRKKKFTNRRIIDERDGHVVKDLGDKDKYLKVLRRIKRAYNFSKYALKNEKMSARQRIVLGKIVESFDRFGTLGQGNTYMALGICKTLGRRSYR